MMIHMRPLHLMITYFVEYLGARIFFTLKFSQLCRFPRSFPIVFGIAAKAALSNKLRRKKQKKKPTLSTDINA